MYYIDLYLAVGPLVHHGRGYHVSVHGHGLLGENAIVCRRGIDHFADLSRVHVGITRMYVDPPWNAFAETVCARALETSRPYREYESLHAGQ